jgi:hypothetical protein
MNAPATASLAVGPAAAGPASTSRTSSGRTLSGPTPSGPASSDPSSSGRHPTSPTAAGLSLVASIHAAGHSPKGGSMKARLFELRHSTQTLAERLAEYFRAHPNLKRQDDLVSAEARAASSCRTTSSTCFPAVARRCRTRRSSRSPACAARPADCRCCGAIRTTRPWTSTAGSPGPAPCLRCWRALPHRPHAWRCSRQRRQWPWTDNERFMNVPLAELRSTFGIRVTHEERT